MIRATAELQFQLSQRNIQAMLRQLQGQLNVPLNINTSRAQRDIDAVGDSLRRSTGFATNFGLAVGDSARRFAAYGAGVAIIAKIAFAFKSAASELLKFDKDITTLAQVTGKTKSNLAGVSDEILRLSVRTGISASKLSELTVTLSQAELKGEDLSNALNVIAASDLAPSFENMEDSVEGLIAIMQQFKRPSTEFRRQFGFINELSKGFAIESGDIIEGVKRAGSVFESAGASLEEFASIMTIVRSTTRESAESIATGLKTITERIQRPEIIDHLEELGVELRDVEGKFIGPLKAFQNLSAALNKRGSLTKGSLELISVAKEIGGGRNLTKIIPLLNSAAKAQKIMEDASKKAADSLAKDEAVALQSVSKQLDILRADFVKFIHEVSVSDEFKDMAKSALGFAKAMVEVLKATKPFIPIIAQLGVMFGARSIVRGFTGAASPRFSGLRDDVPTYATGGAIDGIVRGPGSGTSDDIYARLSNGEFVIKASSVAKVGRNRLEYLNARGEIPAFARGGSVGGEPVSAFGGISNPLISLAVFAALSKAMNGLKENTDNSSGTFDKLKDSIIPVIPAGILLYQGFKVTRTQLDLMAASIRNVNGAVNGFTTWMNDAPRRAYERERTGNLEDAQRANGGAPLNRRQMKLADPITNRVLAAGGSVGEAAVARRAFGRSLNSRVAGEGGNYVLAQRRAREAALEARRDDIVNTPTRLSAIRDTQATSIRNAAAAGAPGFAGFTARQIAAITNNNAAARTGRDRAIGSLQGNISIANWDVERTQRRVRAYGTPSVRRMTNERDDLVAQRAAATTPGQRRAFTRRINVLNTQITDKTTDLNFIRARKAQIAATNQSVRSLQALNATEDALAAANTRRATTNVGDNIAEFDRGLQRPPRSLRRTLRRGAQQFSDANQRFGGAAAGITAAGIAGAAALSSASIAASRKNAEEAITSGNGAVAYSETLNASREERRQSAILTAGGVGGTIGSIFGPLGTAVGGVTGALIGMTGAVEYITSWFTGIDPEEQSKQEAKDARMASEVNAVNKMMNDGVTKYGDQMRLADSVKTSDGPEAAARKREYEAQARISLATIATSAVTRVKNGDARTVDALDGYKILQEQLTNQFSVLANEVVSTGGTFEDVKNKAPELVAALAMITNEIGDQNLSNVLMEQIASIQRASAIFKEEAALRSLALNELNNAISYQKRVNASLQALASETRSISMSGDSASLRGQAISGDVSSQPIKEFGISLSEISTLLTADFHETLNAVGSFSQELQSQATAYKNILTASEQFSKELPSILTDNLNPASQKSAGRMAIDQAYGGLGKTKVDDIKKQFEDLITNQETSGDSADVKSRQINDFIKSINEEIGKAFLDDLEKGRAERQSRLSAIADTLEKEASLRAAALDKQIETGNALDDFRQSFVKATSDSVANARRGRTDRILKTIGGSTTGNDAADFTSLTNSRNDKVEEIDRLNASSKIGIITDEEVKRKAKLVEEVNILGKALSELTNVSEDVTQAQESLAKLEDKQSKLKGKASELAFGGNDVRQQFARSLVAQRFVSSGGNLQDLPEQLRSELFSFLQEFGDAKVFNGQSGTDIINTQTSNFLRSLGYSNDQVASLMTDMKPVEQKQLDALLQIVTNTANEQALPQFARGGQARGVDTIPAMVAPGEFIVSAANAKKNKGLLHSINNGTVYAAKGGEAGKDGKIKRKFDFEDRTASRMHMNAKMAYLDSSKGDPKDIQSTFDEMKRQEAILKKRGLWDHEKNIQLNIPEQSIHEESLFAEGRSSSPKTTPRARVADDTIEQTVEKPFAFPSKKGTPLSARQISLHYMLLDKTRRNNEQVLDIGLTSREQEEQYRARNAIADAKRAITDQNILEKESIFGSREIAGSSTDARAYARQNRQLGATSLTGIDAGLNAQANGYNQFISSPSLSAAEKEKIGKEYMKVRKDPVLDRTGLRDRFREGGEIERYYATGKTSYEREMDSQNASSSIGQAGNIAMQEARRADLIKAASVKANAMAKRAEYDPTREDIKKNDIKMRAIAQAKADKKLSNSGNDALAINNRKQDLADIQAKKIARAEGRDTYKVTAANPMGEPKPVSGPKGPPKPKQVKEVNRLMTSEKKKLAPNTSVITGSGIVTKDQILTSLQSFASPSNIDYTRRFLDVPKTMDDASFLAMYQKNITKMSEEYGQIMSTLFGTSGGKVEGNKADGLFSKAKIKGGVFDSAMINSDFLYAEGNKDKISKTLPMIESLLTAHESKVLDKVSNKAFSKSMANLRQAVVQVLDAQKQKQEQKLAADAVQPIMSAEDAAFFDEYSPLGSRSATEARSEQIAQQQAANQNSLPMPNISTGNPDENMRDWQRLSLAQQQEIIDHNNRVDAVSADNQRRIAEAEAYNREGREENARQSNEALESSRRNRFAEFDSRNAQVMARSAQQEKERQKVNELMLAKESEREEKRRKQVATIVANERQYNSISAFYDGGIVGGKGGRDNNVVRAARGEGIVKTSTMNKIGPKAFEQLNKTGTLPQEELKSSVDMLMKTPTWMADFTSAVKALAGTSIKAELAPVSVNVRINGAEVLASINADMKDLIKREVVSAVSNMYHDNSGKHMVRGMA